MGNNSPKHDGFTLLEVIISLTIITILIVGIYGLSIGTIKNNKEGEIKQKATLYGQGVFEGFRSSDVTKTLTGSGSNYTLTLSNGIKLVGDSSYKVSGYDLGDGYKADINVVRNSSTIGSGQTLQGTTSDYIYTVNLKKTKLEVISMGDEKDKNAWAETILEDVSKATEIDVDINSDNTGKTIEVKIKGGESFSKHFDMSSEDDKKKEIKLSINCAEYNLSKEYKDNGFEVHVFNHDEVPVNICLQKSNTIDGSAIAEIGRYKLYNNRSSSETVSNMGNLYDITVDVKKDNEEKVIFTGQISQNLRIDDDIS